MNSRRQSNFELLRILAILFIISFHYVYKGGFNYDSLSVNKMIINVFTMVGEVGVNLFVLITGYFLIQSKNGIKISKVVLLILEIIFYNLINLLIVSHFDISIFINNLTYIDFFPFIYNRYWFATAYILLYIFSPYINKLIQSLSLKENIKFIMILLIIYCFIPTFFGMKINDTETLLYYNRFIWLIVIYISGAFIQIYKNEIKWFNKKFKFYALISVAYFLFIILIMLFIEMNIGFFMNLGIKSATYFWRPNTIITYMWSLLIFLAFSQLNFHNSFVNKIASTTFGIYLLHDGIANPILWKIVFKNATHTYSRYLLIHILLATFIIMILGIIIDLIRQCFEKIILYWYMHLFGGEHFEKVS